MSAQSHEERVYNEYRRVLKSQRGGLASERKQKAREIVSQSRKLPISQVKQIVREQDEINGVTHEHPAAYLEDLATMAEFQKIQDAYDVNPGPCPVCGATGGVDGVISDVDNVIRVRMNRRVFAETGTKTPLLSCFMCYLNEKSVM